MENCAIIFGFGLKEEFGLWLLAENKFLHNHNFMLDKYRWICYTVFH